MLKAFLFSAIFVIVALIGWAFLAPLIFPHADAKKMGEASFPLIVVVPGGIGFALGWYRSKKKNPPSPSQTPRVIKTDDKSKT